MNSEQRTCQNCKQAFAIEPEDFAFYEKIEVPPPTRCPRCRLRRRMMWRNELVLHRRESDLSGASIISQFSADAPFPVYGAKEFLSRDWEVPWLDYDANRSFLDQFRELQLKTPQCALLTDLQSIEAGSIYQNAASRNKNCYLVSAAGDNEDCMFANNLDYSKSVVDALWTRYGEHSYECVDCLNSSHLFFAELCRNCREGWFLFDCKNCHDCFGCVGLKNASYCWWNEQLTEEEYARRFREAVNTLTPERIEEYQRRLSEMSLKQPRKFSHSDTSSIASCTGDYLVDSRNTHEAFVVFSCEDSKYVSKLIRGKDCYDLTDWGDPAELCYESITIGKSAYRVLFSNNCWPECRDLQYCDSCSNSHDCFGCIGLKDGAYQILNKQYSKEEYNALVSRIIEDMKRREEYGEFFPERFSPFPYNDSIAQGHFPLTQEEAEAKGYVWQEPEERNHPVTIAAADLPESVVDVEDSILQEVIACAHAGSCKDGCATAFRIIPAELQFYRQFGLPLPRLCFNCRHARRFALRNPLQLWRRRCQCAGPQSVNGVYKNTNQDHRTHVPQAECPVQFSTTYSPDRPETVYCEQCYNAEIV